MAKAKTTPLQEKFQGLPKYITFEKDIQPALCKAGYEISERTFQRHREKDPNTIPTGILKIYAQLFNCTVDDLLNKYTKVSPIIKQKSIGKRNGLKTIV
jgi:hypothetical protein